MPTYYVSNAASNGYVVGNDANAGTSKALAVLTFTQALVLAVSGDTICLNDGTYTAPTTPGYWNIAENGLTVLPENDWMATLAGDGVYTARLFNVNSAAAVNATFGKINIDGVNTQLIGFYVNQTTNLATFTFNGTRFKNFVHKPIANVHVAGAMHLTLNDVEMEGTNWQRGGVHMPTLTTGGLVVNGLKITQSGRSNSEGALVYLHANAAGVTATVSGVYGTSALAASAGSVAHSGVLIQNVLNAVIKNCSGLTISGVGAGSASATLYEISANATGVQGTHYGIIENCHGTNATSSGKTALIGSDAQLAATTNQHNYGRIINCNLNGSAVATGIHGPMLGHGTGGRIEGCNTKYCGTGGGGLLKSMVAGTGPLGVPIAAGNKATFCYGTFAYQKGSVGAVHTNNTLITSAGYAPTFELAAFDDTALPVNQNNNGIFANNVFTGTTAPTYTSVQGTPGNALDTSTGNLFYLSHYDTTLGSLTNKWRNGSATIYADVAAFNTALSPAGYNCVNAALGLDVNNLFPSDSAYLGIGYKTWLDTPNPSGSTGKPFSSFDIDLGAIQSSFGSFDVSRL